MRGRAMWQLFSSLLEAPSGLLMTSWTRVRSNTYYPQKTETGVGSANMIWKHTNLLLLLLLPRIATKILVVLAENYIYVWFGSLDLLTPSMTFFLILLAIIKCIFVPLTCLMRCHRRHVSESSLRFTVNTKIKFNGEGRWGGCWFDEGSIQHSKFYRKAHLIVLFPFPFESVIPAWCGHCVWRPWLSSWRRSWHASIPCIFHR